MNIESVAFGGAGVGRVEGMVVFVPFTVEGDLVEAEIVRIKRRYMEARPLAVLRSSPYRTDPLCKYYGLCGGCHYQHISYEYECRVKEKQVRDVFERIGKFDSPPVRAIVPSPDMYRYRQKAEFHAAEVGPEGIVMGFMGVDGRSLVDIDRCEILDESINAEYGRVRRDETLAGRLSARNVFWSGVPFGREGKIDRSVGSVEMTVPVRGFFQANALLVERLAGYAAEACRDSSKGMLLDCCCGSGLFALFAGLEGRGIMGIDVDGEALECARANMERYGLEDAAFYRGRLEDVLERLPGMTDHPVPVAILDPPRTGSTERAVESLAQLVSERIIYISCNPATQARDARRLVDRGYDLVELQPFDMFPRTRHVEVAAIFSRR